MLLIFAIAINLDNIHNQKTWSSVWFIVVMAVVCLAFVLAIYMRIQHAQSRKLARDIKQNVIPAGPDRDALVAKLTTRQREILELILLRMSNREIMEELSLEPSSLRSHINRIYKVLQIRARKAIR